MWTRKIEYIRRDDESFGGKSTKNRVQWAQQWGIGGVDAKNQVQSAWRRETGDLVAYRLPANIFLFVASGSAYVRLDERKCYLKRHHLLHAPNCKIPKTEAALPIWWRTHCGISTMQNSVQSAVSNF